MIKRRNDAETDLWESTVFILWIPTLTRAAGEDRIKLRGTAWKGGHRHDEKLPHDPKAQHIRQPKLDMKSEFLFKIYYHDRQEVSGA